MVCTTKIEFNRKERDLGCLYNYIINAKIFRPSGHRGPRRKGGLGVSTLFRSSINVLLLVGLSKCLLMTHKSMMDLGCNWISNAKLIHRWTTPVTTAGCSNLIYRSNKMCFLFSFQVRKSTIGLTKGIIVSLTKLIIRKSKRSHLVRQPF